MACSSIIEGTIMEQYAGIDVSLESASVCVVDSTGRIMREAKVVCEPEALIAWFTNMARIGLEAGPLCARYRATDASGLVPPGSL